MKWDSQTILAVLGMYEPLASLDKTWFRKPSEFFSKQEPITYNPELFFLRTEIFRQELIKGHLHEPLVTDQYPVPYPIILAFSEACCWNSNGGCTTSAGSCYSFYCERYIWACSLHNVLVSGLILCECKPGTSDLDCKTLVSFRQTLLKLRHRKLIIERHACLLVLKTHLSDAVKLLVQHY